MNGSTHKCAIELLLDSIFCTAGNDGLPTGFLYGPPDSFHKGLGTTVYFRQQQLVRAALYVRQQGPPYLRYLAVNDICSLLRSFFVDNYWHISEEVFFKRFACSFAEYLSTNSKEKLAAILALSDVFNPKHWTTLFPLVVVRVEADFVSQAFFLCAPKKLPPNLDKRLLRWIDPEQFPPLKNRKYGQAPASWLGVRSPTPQSSAKMKAPILGALALTPMFRYRYSFSMRKMFGGFCTITDDISTSYCEAHTPPLAEDIVIGERDAAWLGDLASKFLSPEKHIRRQLRALEYFYRAWPADQSERFPTLCMALDAVFGDANQATQAVVDGVRAALGEHISEQRLRLLTALRASVIHGGAPDVYDSSKYARYYRKYGQDPILDLELIVAACLRKIVFGDALTEHPDPHAQLIMEMQAKGRFPKQLAADTILGPENQN